MKFIVTFFSWWFPILCFAQNPTTEEFCQKYQNEALHDISAGTYKLKYFGCWLNPTPSATDTWQFRIRHLQSKYGIEMVNAGPGLDEGEWCYNNVMRDSIKARFGQYFFEIDLPEELERAYPPDLQERIDTGFVFWCADSLPEITAEYDSLHQEFFSHLPLCLDTVQQLFLVGADAIIGKNGKCIGLNEFHPSSTTCSQQDMIQLLAPFQWPIGYLKGQRVRYYYRVRIPSKELLELR